MATELTMRRGDTKFLKFTRHTKDGEPILEKADKVYFTVKTEDLKKSPVIQKTIDDMVFDDNTGEYRFRIQPEDTESLSFISYKYDIQIVSDDVVSTPAVGRLRLLEEVTFKTDEV